MVLRDGDYLLCFFCVLWAFYMSEIPNCMILEIKQEDLKIFICCKEALVL